MTKVPESTRCRQLGPGDKVEIHPAAEMFPLLEGEDFDRLVADIKEHGVLEAVWLDQNGALLDGRNRLAACVALSIECPARVWDGNALPEEFVASMNLQRRHLTAGQRAMIAARLVTTRQGERTDLPSGGGKLSQSQAAEKLEVSPRSVERAARVRKQGVPELSKAVEDGTVTLATASTMVDASPELQRKVAAGSILVCDAERQAREQRRLAGQRYRADRKARAARLAEVDAAGPRPPIHLLRGEFKDHTLKPGEVDAVITVALHSLQANEVLRLSGQVLAADGIMAMLVPLGCLAELPDLPTYRWTLAYLHPGRDVSESVMFDDGMETTVQLRSCWTPLVVYSDVPLVQSSDVMQGTGADPGVSDMVQLLNRFTAPGQLVVDPYMGDGTLAVAAQQCGRRYVGFEPDPEQYARACERVALAASDATESPTGGRSIPIIHANSPEEYEQLVEAQRARRLTLRKLEVER